MCQNVARSGKIGLICTKTEIHFLSVHERCIHALSWNTKYLTINSQVSFTDGLLPMLLSHRDAFFSSEGINRTAWGTKLLVMAVMPHPEYWISSCHILKAQHYCVNPNGCFSLGALDNWCLDNQCSTVVFLKVKNVRIRLVFAYLDTNIGIRQVTEIS